MRHRYDLLNHIADRNRARRYLEIGVASGECFRAVRVSAGPGSVKVGVDPRSPHATHSMTSDAFFADHTGAGFDLVFVDGLHREEQVLRDVLAAWSILRPGGVVVVHDCSPPTERSQLPHSAGGPWCGDVWRAWARLVEATPGLYCVDLDFGCGVVEKDSVGCLTAAPRCVYDYHVMDRDRRRYLELVSVDEFVERFVEREEGA